MDLNDAVSAFIGDVKGILAGDGPSAAGLERIAERMRRFILDPAVQAADGEVGGNVHAGRQSAPLYTDETGLTLVRARFGPPGNARRHADAARKELRELLGGARSELSLWARFRGFVSVRSLRGGSLT